MTSLRDADKTKPYIPLASGADDGYNKDGEATATCFCGAVQLAFPISGPGVGDRFVCNCTDCHKLTASMFASNFTIHDPYLKHLRGRDNLSTFTTSKTPASGGSMTNYFCRTCGTLMYRLGSNFPGANLMRIGTIDDFSLMETNFRPNVEQFVKDRVSWLPGVQSEGIRRAEGMDPDLS